MNAVITGIFGLRNRGIEALVVPTVEQLRQRHPNLPITVLTRTPDYDETRLQKYGVKLVERTIEFTYPGLSLRQRIRSKLPSYTPPAPKVTPAVHAIRQASVAIASGGDVFSSDYGSLYKHLKPLQVALDAGTQVVFLAHSIGPFKTQKETEAWLSVARRSKLVSVREKISYKYLTEQLGLSPDLVKHTADPAFLLEPASGSEVANLRSSYRITSDRPVIGLSISQGISTFSGCDRHQHLEAWHQVVQLILEKLNAQVLIIPHVQETYVKNDDRIAATNLLRSFDFDPRIRIAGADHSASEFKGLIGSCDMIVAERMHAAIAGLSSGICTVAIGYSIKAEGIMTDLLGAESLKGGLLIPIHDFLDSEKASQKILTAWEQRQDVSNQLKDTLPRIKKNSASNYDMISKLLY